MEDNKYFLQKAKDAQTIEELKEVIIFIMEKITNRNLTSCQLLPLEIFYYLV
jgi:hypothetical protein